MDNELRLEYLTALGIDVWVPRDSLSNCITTSIESVNYEYSVTDDWEKLKSEISQCKQCDLFHIRSQSLLGAGSRQAEWLWITEAPNKIEDLKGQPILGPQGDLFTEMLRSINLTREEVFVTHIIKCMTPDHRTPHASELLSCKSYIQRQIRLIKPKIIIALGHEAAQALINQKAPLSKLRSMRHLVNNTPLFVINHPEYLLRFLNEKKLAWLDLQNAFKLYTELKDKKCGD